MLKTEVLSLVTTDDARVSGVLYTKDGTKVKTGVIIMHPVVDFHHHYAARPLAEAGIVVLALNSRYTRFEHAVIMERVLLDLAAGVKLLRERGCSSIALIGNSGGGPLMAFYQGQAQKPSLSSTPDGQPLNPAIAKLPPADALIQLNAHRGRHHFLTLHLDPSVTDETDMFSKDPAFDMYDRKNGPPYDSAWLARYREMQIARNDRITAWAIAKIKELEAKEMELDVGQSEMEGQQIGMDGLDMPFFVYRTMADPRTMDLSIEPNDREIGTVWGPPLPLNWSTTALGRVSTVRSWLSHYSWSKSNADGPACTGRTSVPLLVLIGTAERGCYQGDARAYMDATQARDKELHLIQGGTHFMRNQPQKIQDTVSKISGWLNERFA